MLFLPIRFQGRHACRLFIVSTSSHDAFAKVRKISGTSKQLPDFLFGGSIFQITLRYCAITLRYWKLRQGYWILEHPDWVKKTKRRTDISETAYRWSRNGVSMVTKRRFDLGCQFNRMKRENHSIEKGESIEWIGTNPLGGRLDGSGQTERRLRASNRLP